MRQNASFFFLTHKWNMLIELKLQRLLNELSDVVDVFVLMHKSNSYDQIRAESSPFRDLILFFDVSKLPQHLGYPFSLNNSFTPGSVHFPVLMIAISSRYSHNFLIEDDVEFSGNWRDFVLTVLDNEPDFACSYPSSFIDKPNWNWWELMKPGASDIGWATKKANLWRSFNPVYCLSQRAAHLIHIAHKDGWRAHQELLLATILKNRGCRIIDLWDLGFCVGREQDYVYGQSIEALPTVRWRPNISQEEFSKRSTGRTLFHPVKDPWFFDSKTIIDVNL